MIFKIETENRIGITHDVIECFASANVDIMGMEVRPHYIYLKIPEISQSQLAAVKTAIQSIPGSTQVDLIQYLPSEERENRMNTILATISEGIISLDERLCVKTVNRAAEEMLQTERDQMIGKPFSELWGQKMTEPKRCLTEKIEMINIPFSAYHLNECANLFASYLPIHSMDQSEAQGVVVILRDLKQIHQLIESANRSGAIHLDKIIHVSTSMKQCIETAKKIAKTNATVILTGESGTGKDIFARAIHYESPRSAKPFVPINCAAIPESILESELFGYAEGAFTGAVKGGKPGLFEMAQGGTLFLDEIAEIPFHLQAKLLRVLEDRTVRRVGGTKAVPIDVRIIAATNRNLADMAKKGLFREDLFYRLHVIPIFIPPLRERISDIPLLAEFFMKKICQSLHRAPLSFSHQALHTLQSYSWPGNVRELQNMIERVLYLHQENEYVIEQIDLDEENSDILLMPRYNPTEPFKRQIEAYEKKLLQEALQTFKSVRQAAVHLGLSHTAVLNKMRKYQLD